MRRIFIQIFTALLLLSMAPAANAHSTLISSLPKNGAELNVVPKFVSLKFNERLLILADKNPNSISVLSPKGILISLGTPKVKGNTLSISLKTKKATGKFRVTYRVVSADGHPISGEYFFTVN